MPFQIEISNRDNKRIIVKFDFLTLNTWSYEYVSHDQNYTDNSETGPTCHILGIKNDLLYKSNSYDISFTNTRDTDEPFSVTAKWYLEKNNNGFISCEDLDDDEKFEVLKSKIYTGTIPSNNPNYSIYETLTYK